MKREEKNWPKTRAVCIVQTLAKAGHFPRRETKKEAWFLSSFLPETHASLKVSKVKNLWFDHGSGFGGNNLDLILRLYDLSLLDAHDFLSDIPSSFSFHPQIFEPQKNDGIIIKTVCPIWHNGLKIYLNERNIILQSANKYCKEVHYSRKGNYYFSIGLQNDSGGWELRNTYYKSSSSPKDINYLSNGGNRLVVTEGMFDFLTVTNFRHDNMSYLNLNSLSFLKRAMNHIERFKHVELYLDNDKAGNEATEWLIQKHKGCIDKSNLYQGYKDRNEMWKRRNREHGR